MNPLLTQCFADLVAAPSRPISLETARAVARLAVTSWQEVQPLAALSRSLNRGPQALRCGIINARSGRCAEDCAFCAQSARHRTGAPVYPLVDGDVLQRRAEELAAAGVERFGIVTSGTRLAQAELDAVCEAALRLGRTSIKLCISPGMVDVTAARQLREAGFTRYHHNLETAASFFPSICTTHAYEDDIASLRMAREAGFELCCGGIFGLGEDWEARFELAATLAELEVDAVPVNFLIPVPGTRLENRPLLAPQEALAILTVLRLLLPRMDILVCGGRRQVLEDWGRWIFAAGANGVMTGDYLTTPGCGLEEDRAWMRTLGVVA